MTTALRLPAIVAILLAAAIGAELVLVDYSRVAGTVPVRSPGDERPSAAARSAEAHRDDLMATIIDKPLFLPGRRSGSGDVASQADVGLPRLSGIVQGKGRSLAVFQRPGDKPKSLGKGDRIGAWTIEEIHRADVVLKKPGGTMTIVPAKDDAVVAAGGGMPPLAVKPSPPLPPRPFAGAKAVRP